MSRLENAIKSRFLPRIVQIDNFFNMIRLFILFFFSIHIMSCIWIRLNIYDGGLIYAAMHKGTLKSAIIDPKDLNKIELADGKQLAMSEMAKVYIDSLYFVTTSMTTVGYGDISATG